MPKITVLKPIRVTSGRVTLDDDQHRRRVHILQKAGRQPGVYKLLKPTMFKRGEVLEIDEVPKELLPRVDLAPGIEVAEQQPTPAPRPAQAARVKPQSPKKVAATQSTRRNKPTD